MNGEVVLIDLSSIAHPIWHMSQSEPDPNKASQGIVARVRALTSQHPHAAICCDCGKSFRKDLSPSYKANRPEHEASLHHQIDLAREQLEADGFPVWAVKTFEADDVIAAATTQALAADLHVLIVSADKDLLQLVGPRVRAMNPKNGAILDADAVFAKFGVRPDQMRDYLSLVGDKSDNVKGAPGIGEVKAAALLREFHTISGIYQELNLHPTKFKPAMASALRAFEPFVDDTQALITLRTDVDLPFASIAQERVPKDAELFAMAVEDDMDSPDETPIAPEAPVVTEGEPASGPVAVAGTAAPVTTLAVREDAVTPAPAEWELQLDPRSMKDARIIAKDFFDSRMFSAYGTPQGVLSTIMLGRELGLPAMASLRQVHVIEGKHALAASLMVALVLKSGFAEFFEPVSFSETEATYETKRKGARTPIRLTHTIEMAAQAWPKSKADWEKSFLASGWGRNPTDMLCARASSRLARMIYPDVVGGLYTPDEISEIREQQVA